MDMVKNIFVFHSQGYEFIYLDFLFYHLVSRVCRIFLSHETQPKKKTVIEASRIKLRGHSFIILDQKVKK